MSISLPNGTLLPTSSQSSSQVTASVTRILHLTNFSPELKTRDIQLIFKDWEGEKGGFRIKWLDDVNALVVFNDPVVAKRAYLSLLLNTPTNFSSPAQIRPYDRPDAAAIIQQLTARAMGHRSSMSSAMSFSQANPNGISGLPEHHGRAASISGGLSGFVMPLGGKNLNSNSNNSLGLGSGFGSGTGFGNGGSNSFSSGSGSGSGSGPGNRNRNLHTRSGSASASSNWSRSGGFGNGSGVLNFPSSNSGRLPTHSESSMDPSRSSSSEEDAIVIMDNNISSRFAGGGGGGGGGGGTRRESLSAEKALREVEKALAHVEAKG